METLDRIVSDMIKIVTAKIIALPEQHEKH